MSSIREQDAERLVNALDQEIRSRKRGTIGAINTALGYSHSWWQQRVISKDITVKQLLQVLDHLGLDPVKLVRQVIGSDDGLELNQPQGQVPELVVTAERRFEKGKEGLGVGLKWIKTLDERLLKDHQEVIGLVQWGIEHVELKWLPRLLRTLASAWFLAVDLDDAHHAAQAGIRMAKQRNDLAELGKQQCLLSYIVANLGDLDEALNIAERAFFSSLKAGKREAAGGALVAEGTWLFYLNQLPEALEVLEYAERFLPAKSSRERLAAVQISGLVYQKLGDLSMALKKLEEAEAVMLDKYPWDEAKLLWLRARIYADDEQHATSVECYQGVVEFFLEHHLGEAALATCELVRVQLQIDRAVDAYATAEKMRALVEPLRHNKIISAAIADLLRSGQKGLTLALVDRLIAKLKSERQSKQNWFALRIDRLVAVNRLAQ